MDRLRRDLPFGLRRLARSPGFTAVAAMALSRFIASLLFPIEPNDPSTLVAIGLLIAAVALAACRVPARRAMPVDPAWTLRAE